MLLIVALLATAVAGLAASAGADDTHTYKIEMYNAFGIVQGSDVRIAGVNAGTVTDLDINDAKRAVVTVELAGDLGTLGQNTKCSSEPQSLIAEYFISCEPAGPPMADANDQAINDCTAANGCIPAAHVAQTVQNDLVQNTLREPFKQNLQLLINEFGTALAGNPEALNQAIRLGAPALTQLRKVTQILASQNTIIRDLNVNSDEVISQLAARREDVVRFIQKARDTAAASAARRQDLSRDFEILDDFLARLRPTLAQLENVARQNTPLLTDLQAAAPGLNELALSLPAFSRASKSSLDSLGEASNVGKTALRRGQDEIRLLADAGKKAPYVSEVLADFLRDIDDPRRAVEIDDRVPKDTGRTDPRPGKKDTKGYTGLEGLLNYVYYQTGALNQYDQNGHLLHFSLYDVFTGPCGQFSTGHDAKDGSPYWPTDTGGRTTSLVDAAGCVGGLGPNQPGITESPNLPRYDPTVCPNGTEPEAAKALCDPGVPARKHARAGSSSEHTGAGAGPASGGGETTTGGGETSTSTGGGDSGGGGGGGGSDLGSNGQDQVPDNILDDILNLPDDVVNDLPQNLQDALNGLSGQPQSSQGSTGTSSGATQDLLDFLFSS
jgi:phospholipid/cholesterol/gamma-HCH transport system substrate-binding protein